MTGYPVTPPAVSQATPKHPDLTHYPRWGKTKDENIIAFRNFLIAQNLYEDLTDFDTRMDEAPSSIHWAMIAETIVKLHWVK